jgi:hypothetical protein
MNWDYILPAIYKTIAWIFIPVMAYGVGCKVGADIEREANRLKLQNCQMIISGSIYDN